MLARDIRSAFRFWTRNPQRALPILLALGLGIGLTSTLYSVLHGTFFRPLPFPDSQELVRIERTNFPAGLDRLPVSVRDFLAWQTRQRSFEGLVAWLPLAVNVSGAEGPPQRSNAAYTSANLFTVLGIQPSYGRNFVPADADPAAPPVVILGDSLWRDRFGRSPKALGKTIRIYGEPATVIGIMPEGFRFPFNQSIWIPLKLDPVSAHSLEHARLHVFGRLRDGVELEQASAELSRLAAQLAKEHPETNEGIGTVATPYVRSYADAKLHSNQLLMFGGAVAVFLIACANAAGLLLIHSILRSHELAIRGAVGAEKRHLTSQILAESSVLSLGAGGLALGLTWLGTFLYRASLEKGTGAFWEDVRPDGSVLVFLLATALAGGLLSGLLPAIRATGPRMIELLKQPFSGASGTRAGRLSHFLVVVQLALSCCLLIAAGLTVKSILAIRTNDFGFETAHLLTAEVSLSGNRDLDPEGQARSLSDLTQKLEAIPGVRSVALTTIVPGRYKVQPVPFGMEGQPAASPESRPSTQWAVVTPSFFDTFGLHVLEGRALLDSDDETAPAVGVINRSFARRHFPKETPLGKRLQIEETWITVVGVVPDMLMGGIGLQDPATVYTPLAQNLVTTLGLVIRTERSPLEIAAPAREVVAAVVPDQPLYNVKTMNELLAGATRHHHLAGIVFTVFGIGAFYLALLGVYSTTALSVGQRTQEFKIRIALGARRREITSLVLRREMVSLVLGAFLGVGLSLGLSRLMTVLLYKVENWDFAVFAIVPAGLLAAGMAACLLPVRRTFRAELAAPPRNADVLRRL